MCLSILCVCVCVYACMFGSPDQCVCVCVCASVCVYACYHVPLLLRCVGIQTCLALKSLDMGHLQSGMRNRFKFRTVSKPHYLLSLSNQNQFPKPLLFSSWAKIFSLWVCLMKFFFSALPQRDGILRGRAVRCVCLCVIGTHSECEMEEKQSTLT